jgi:hypothetical protein
MIEIEIPAELIERRRGGIDKARNGELRYGTPGWSQYPNSSENVWTCFRPDVEDWITRSFKVKHRKAIVVFFRHHHTYPFEGRNSHLANVETKFYAQFRDDHDAALFKLFWF